MRKDKPCDVASAIIEYESGTLSAMEALDLFSHLVKTRLAWSLQGSYGRTARALIERGFLDEHGNITPEGEEAVYADA